MGNIVDISKFQPCNLIDWKTFSQNVDLLIIRVQYGSTVIDSQYYDHVKCAKENGVPFNTYAFPCFISVDDARVEARDAATRQDKDSNVLWLDIESEYDSNGNPIGITKLSQSVRLEGIKAYVDELRKQGVQKVGAYVAHNVYEPWGINSIIGIFDCVWIPRYGINDGQPHTKPNYPCDLWQYSSLAKLPGYPNALDVSMLTGSKPLEYFTGKATQSSPTVISSDKPLQVVKALVDSDVRAEPSHDSAYVGNVHKGQIYNVWKRQGDWHFVVLESGTNKEGWVDGNNGANLEWVDNPGITPSIHIVTKGETLGKIASANGTTVAKLCALNNIKDPNKISIGQKIVLK